MKMNNTHNGYAAALTTRRVHDIFADCPKSVCAAVAVSVLTCGGDHLDKAQQRFCLEWKRLHDAGIVPQKPPAYALKLAAIEEARENA